MAGRRSGTPGSSESPPPTSSSPRYRTQGSAQTRSGSSKSRTAHGSQITTDHQEIQDWVESRGGHPACVRQGGGQGDAGALRIAFPDDEETSLQQIPWEDFFEKFDQKGLEFLYQIETTSGQQSRFNKFISRQSVENTTGRPRPVDTRRPNRPRSQNRPGRRNTRPRV